jgi:hypothetical protein
MIDRALKGFNNTCLTFIEPFQGSDFLVVAIPALRTGLFKFNHFVVACVFEKETMWFYVTNWLPMHGMFHMWLKKHITKYYSLLL